MANGTISFKHSGDIGDIVASLAAVKEICERDGCKAEIILDTSGGENDEFVSITNIEKRTKFNESAFDFIRPLVERQPYISSVSAGCPEKVDYNLNEFRRFFVNRDIAKVTNRNLMFLHQCCVGLQYGYHGPWLAADGCDCNHAILASRTVRNNSAHLFVESMAKTKDVDFIGTDFEWEAWKQSFGRYPKNRVAISNCLDAANHIKSSDIFFSNSTAFYWVAIGLGHRKIVHELCIDAPTSYFPNQTPPVDYVIGAHHVK